MTTDWGRYRGPADSLLDAVGRTPLVRLARVAPDVELYAKVEWYGPTGSVKDRIYSQMLTEAERRGELAPGMSVIECTTGNAGIACAAVAAIKGYPCVIVMPEGMSAESGEEIWEQTNGDVQAVVAAQGTGGWITGAARALKAHDPSLLAFAVEPAECPLISEQRWGTHGVPGIGDGIVPPNLDLALMDGIVVVSTDDALEMARRLARDEGMLCGPSSGINVVAALKVADKHPELTRLVTVIPDTGQRYLSGELFGDRPVAEEPVREHRLDDATIAMLEEHRDRLEFLS